MTATLRGTREVRSFGVVLRALAVMAACALAPAAAGAERLILYFNEDNPRVAAALAKLRAAIDSQGVERRHRVRLEHVAIDFSDQRGIREALRVARARDPAALVASSALVAQLAKEEGITVPVVFATHQDPIRLGLAASLRRPGGTMTGFMLYRSDEGKRLELLREISPKARKVGVVVDEWWDRAPDDQYPSAAVLQRIAREEFGMEIEYFQVDTLAALRALAAQPRARAMEAWYIPPTRIGNDHPEAVTAAIASLHRPAIYSLSLYAQGGGVLSYQTVFEDPFATWAKMLSLILDGFPPGEIPVERPRAFELAVNVKAARDQGIAIPKSILLRATHFY